MEYIQLSRVADVAYITGGQVNAYKILSVAGNIGCARQPTNRNNYYYIPAIHAIATIRGTRVHVMVPNRNYCFNFEVFETPTSKGKFKKQVPVELALESCKKYF